MLCVLPFSAPPPTGLEVEEEMMPFYTQKLFLVFSPTVRNGFHAIAFLLVD